MVVESVGSGELGLQRDVFGGEEGLEWLPKV